MFARQGPNDKDNTHLARLGSCHPFLLCPSNDFEWSKSQHSPHAQTLPKQTQSQMLEKFAQIQLQLRFLIFVNYSIITSLQIKNNSWRRYKQIIFYDSDQHLEVISLLSN